MKDAGEKQGGRAGQVGRISAGMDRGGVSEEVTRNRDLSDELACQAPQGRLGKEEQRGRKQGLFRTFPV